MLVACAVVSSGTCASACGWPSSAVSCGEWHHPTVWTITHMTTTKVPKQQHRAQNRACNRDQQCGNIVDDVFKCTGRKGQKYSHWIDLMQNSHLRRSFLKSIARKSDVGQHRRFWCQKNSFEKGTKKVQQPQNRCLLMPLCSGMQSSCDLPSFNRRFCGWVSS